MSKRRLNAEAQVILAAERELAREQETGETRSIEEIVNRPGRPKNPCAKIMKPEQAYEVWQSSDMSYTWYVLKKYQVDDHLERNRRARWLCLVVSPQSPDGAIGDVYVRYIRHAGHKLSYNPRALKASWHID